MVDGIGNSKAHQLLVSDFGNDKLQTDTSTQLRGLNRARGEGRTSILELGALGRFKAHVAHLGDRTNFVTQQNALVVRAFTNALSRNGVSSELRDRAVAHLQSQASQLNANKTLLSFADLGQALEVLDDHARQTLESYLPASVEGKSAIFKVETDGAAFKALAEKHNINTPELKEQFRHGLEARIFGLANHPEGGPAAAVSSLAEAAEEAAVGLRPGTYDKSVKELFAEFPTDFHGAKSLQDGAYQIAGKPDHQTFIYFKRVSSDNIPYDLQGANDLRDAKLGKTERASTPAAQGKWADVPQKFHFSVDVKALHEGNAWPLLHKLLTSEENPFLQWKIGNADGLSQSAALDRAGVDNQFLKEGPRLFTPTDNTKKQYYSIPRMEDKVNIERAQHEVRLKGLEKGTVTQEAVDSSARNLASLEADLGFLRASYKTAIEDVNPGRCVDGAQFTLYTQNEKGKPWEAGDVKKYTQFLSKLESVLTEAGIKPGELPASDATIPGLRFATFRDEAVGDAAEAADPTLNYQNPPESLRQQYRDTPFYKFVTEAVASEIPAVRV